MGKTLTGKGWFWLIPFCAVLWASPASPSTELAQSDLAGTCLIVGNGPERYAIEALAQEFEARHPQVNLDFFWHENARPVEFVLEHKADIAVTGKLEDDLPSDIVAWDGIAIVTNFANPIEAITTEKLAQILTGKVKFWSQVYEDGPEARITVLHRTSNQNIRQGLEKLLKIEGQAAQDFKLVGSEVQTFKAVNGDTYSISYVSMGPALQALKDGYGVTLLYVNGIEPEYQTVLDGSYPLRRPVVFVMGKKPNPIALAFRDFVLSAEGQRLVKLGASGLFQDKLNAVVKFYPLKDE